MKVWIEEIPSLRLGIPAQWEIRWVLDGIEHYSHPFDLWDDATFAMRRMMVTLWRRESNEVRTWMADWFSF